MQSFPGFHVVVKSIPAGVVAGRSELIVDIIGHQAQGFLDDKLGVVLLFPIEITRDEVMRNITNDKKSGDQDEADR